MSLNKIIRYGSQGSEVTELQKMLNQNGYNLDEDGIFGSQTLSAVTDYRKKNNLNVVAGQNWSVENKPQTAPANSVQKTTTTTQTNTNSFQNQPYQQSDAVSQAQALLQQQLAQKPGAYQSQWQTQLEDAINKILNREQFNYDLNGDALYQQYKNQYMMQGNQAMMDTMGQAAALTGGYGNSYAQTAGQQAYNSYLQQLNDKIPELYQMALDKYQMEGQDLYNQYGLLAGQEEQDYGRYQDQVSNWQTETDRLQNRYDTERNFDYGQWADNRDFSYGQYTDDRNYQYQVGRDQVADQRWQTEFDEAQRQYNESFQYQQDRDKVSDSRWQKEYDEAIRQYNQNLAYQQGRDKVSDSQWNQSFQYQQGRDTVADSQWQKEFDEAVRQWNHKNGITTATDGNTESTPTGNPEPQPAPQPTGYDNGGLSDAGIRVLQKALGVTVDGKWGPASQEAAKAKWGVTSASDAYQKYTGGKDKNGDGWEDGSKNDTGNKLTYSDVALTAAEMRKKGASKNDIYQYISSVVNSSNYKATTSIQQDLAELKAGYVGTGR